MATCKEFPAIKSVKAYTQKSSSGEGATHGADCHNVEDRHWINGSHPRPIANPMSGYSQYANSRKSWGINALGTMIVKVETEDGTIGVGASIGGEPGCFIVERHLSRFVEGEDPRNIELMWDKMFRSTLNYGRKGLPIQAISAVDLALWDLLGKLRNEPVYALLGGKTKQQLPVYCTTARPDLAKQYGFTGAKVPCPYGPSDGDKGLIKNKEFVKHWRDTVGEDYPLMLDCYMALTVPYTIRLAKELEPLKVKWIEEYLPPDNYDGYQQVRDALRGSPILLTTGEHEYTRYGFQRLLKSHCVDILQPDVTWMGGITEARKVIAMAAADDVIVIPHGSSIYSYHLQYAFVNCPLAEYINLSPEADKVVPYFGDIFFDEPLPKDGYIQLPNRPGFGVTLNESKLTRPYQRSEEESREQANKNKMTEQETTATFPF